MTTPENEEKKYSSPPRKARSRLKSVTLDKALLVVVLLGLVIWGIWVCPRLSILPNIIINDYTPYLLSAIAQSLAAVLALVFTISLIIAQLTSRYSHRVLASFFDAPTTGYMCIFIVAVILPFWLLAEPSINGVKGSLVLAIVCLVLLVPYFLGFLKKISPEHVLLDLKNRASEQLLADPNTEPVNVAIIDDIATQALALRDYETFGMSIESLGELLYQAEKLHEQEKMGFKFEYVNRISSRLDFIAINTMEDSRAREYVIAALWKIAEYSTNDGLGGTTSRLVYEFYRLSLKAMEKGFKDTAAEYIFFMHLTGSFGKLRGVENLSTHDITLLLHRAGIEAAKRVMNPPLEKAISSLAEVGGDSIQRDIHESATEVALYLGKIGSEAGSKGMIEEAELACYYLVLIGVSAVSKEDKELRNEAKRALGAIEKSTKSNVFDIAFQKAKDNSGFHSGYQGTEADFNNFEIFFRQTESNSND